MAIIAIKIRTPNKYLAIFVAEQILCLVPKNTHTYNKLIKPEELKSCIGYFLRLIIAPNLLFIFKVYYACSKKTA